MHQPDKNAAKIFWCREFQQKPKFNEVWKPKPGEKFWYIDDYIILEKYYKNYDGHNFIIENGNYFKTYEQAEQRAKEIKVYNLLKNFSLVNWDTELQDEFLWGIEYKDDRYNIVKVEGTIPFLGIYFSSEKAGVEALRRYRKELEEIGKNE
jgi:hypothetical protein